MIDDEHLSLEERSVLPKKGFFVPDELRERERVERSRERLADVDVAMLVDGDADGLGSVVLAHEAFGEDDVGFVSTSPNDLEDSLELFAEHLEEGCLVFVVDLCPDDVESLEAMEDVVEEADEVSWYDHHRWEEDVRSHVEDLGVDLVVGDSDEVCSADVTLQELEDKGYSFRDTTRELVEVTRDHDLWINDDPRSEDVADLGFYLDDLDYVEAVSEGPDVEGEWLEYLEEKRREKQQLIELAVDRAEHTEVDGVSVAHTYGRCSQNEVADALREEGADASVIVKPEGGTSLRGSDSFERCHEVARALDGGGHPKAAGCKPDVFTTLLDYANHWLNEGETARKTVLDAFHEVVE